MKSAAIPMQQLNLDVLPYLVALIPFAVAAIILRILRSHVFETPVRGASAPALMKLYSYISIAAYSLAAMIAIYMVTGAPEALYAAIAAGLVLAAPIVPLLLNAYSYIVLMRSGVVAPGERIEVDGVKGSVHSVGLFATTIRTEAGDIIVIPNRILAERIVAKKPVDRRRLDVYVRLHGVQRRPGALDELIMRVRKTLSEFKAGIRGLETVTMVTGFEGDTVTLLIRVYTVSISAVTVSALISRIISALDAYKPDVRIEVHE